MIISPQKQRWLRFVISGTLSTMVTYVLYLLIHTRLSYQLSYLIAYQCGIVCAYLCNAKFVFQMRLSWRGFFAYPTVYVAQYILSALFLEIMVKSMHMNVSLAPLIITIAIAPLTYIMSKIVLNWSH